MKSADQKTGGEIQRKIPAALENWLGEMRKAEERLQRFPDGNGRSNTHQPTEATLRWALNFARTKLDALSEGDFSNLQRELVYFSNFGIDDPYLSEYVVSKAPWPSKEAVEKTQRWLADIFDATAKREDIQFIEPETKRFLYYSQENNSWKAFSTAEFSGIAVVELFDLIRKNINSLHPCRCADCERQLFVRDRSNQEFCSTRCKWRDAQRNRPGRTIPPERFGKRGRPPGLGSPSSSKLATTKGGTHDKKKRTR